MTEPDYNSAEAWDKIWAIEGANTWRRYPTTAAIINKCIPVRSTVLELGCGVGILSRFLTDGGKMVRGLDISPLAIQIMKAVHNIDGEVFDVRSGMLPFADQQFDWVVASQFLEHFTEPEADKIVAEAARVATSGIFVVPNNLLDHEQTKEHLNIFTKESLNALLTRHYRSVRISTFSDTFETPQLKFNTGISLPVIFARCSRENLL